jgi:hypothetical protein
LLKTTPDGQREKDVNMDEEQNDLVSIREMLSSSGYAEAA